MAWTEQGSILLGQLAARIQNGDRAAESELVLSIQKGLRLIIARQLGFEGVEDVFQNTVVLTLRALRQGALREAKCVLGFIRVIAQRQIQGEIHDRIASRKSEPVDKLPIRGSDPSPEDRVYEAERAELARRALRGCSPSEKEILNRFYCLEQSKEQICGEMGLTETQYRLKKSSAKNRFGRLGREMVEASSKRTAERRRSVVGSDRRNFNPSTA